MRTTSRAAIAAVAMAFTAGMAAPAATAETPTGGSYPSPPAHKSSGCDQGYGFKGFLLPSWTNCSKDSQLITVETFFNGDPSPTRTHKECIPPGEHTLSAVVGAPVGAVKIGDKCKGNGPV